MPMVNSRMEVSPQANAINVRDVPELVCTVLHNIFKTYSKSDRLNGVNCSSRDDTLGLVYLVHVPDGSTTATCALDHGT